MIHSELTYAYGRIMLLILFYKFHYNKFERENETHLHLETHLTGEFRSLSNSMVSRVADANFLFSCTVKTNARSDSAATGKSQK